MKSSLLAFVIACAFSFQVNAQTTYIWKPQGASTSAKVISNWKVATCNGSTATVFPGISDTLLFSNCSGTNATIDTPMNVRFVNVKSNYTGTITLSGSNTFTADKMRVTGGTFSGGSGTLNISSSLSIDGGTFTSTSGTFTLAVISQSLRAHLITTTERCYSKRQQVVNLLSREVRLLQRWIFMT